MSGHPDDNFPAFEHARTLLRAAGHDVVCPAELGQVYGWEWVDYLKRDLRAMLDCDGVAMLDGWATSRGALLEVHVAESLGLEVRHLIDWVSYE